MAAKTRQNGKNVVPTNYPNSYADEILDKHDVLKRLKISERTLNNYIKSGYLRPSLVGGKRFFLLSDLINMIERFRR